MLLHRGLHRASGQSYVPAQFSPDSGFGIQSLPVRTYSLRIPPAIPSSKHTSQSKEAIPYKVQGDELTSPLKGLHDNKGIFLQAHNVQNSSNSLRTCQFRGLTIVHRIGSYQEGEKTMHAILQLVHWNLIQTSPGAVDGRRSILLYDILQSSVRIKQYQIFTGDSLCSEGRKYNAMVGLIHTNGLYAL